MSRFRLSDRWLSAPQPSGEYADSIVPGLKVRVAKSGSKTFAVVRKHHGKAVRARIGRYPSVSLSEARERAMQALASEARPSSIPEPQPAPAIDVEGPTVARFLHDYIAAKRAKGTKSVRQFENALVTGRYALLPFLIERYGRAPMASSVSAGDLQAWMASNHRRCPKYCGHLRSYVVTAWDWAVSSRYDYRGHAIDYGITENIASLLPTAPRVTALDRVLSEDELRTLWRTLDLAHPTHRVLALIIAMGGLRVGEIALTHIDDWREDGWLHLKKTKNQRPHRLPVTDTANPILAISRRLNPRQTGPLFIGSEDATMPVGLAAIGRAATRLNDRLGFPHWTPRDLRRTLKTHLVERGADERWLEIWHNHGLTAGVARRHYIRAEYSELKLKAAREIDSFLTEIIAQSR
ncbi:MAG: integrase arm-type DNA-binding domain-containing protein [Alphaproteobacteria bacterium]|nr:integrase arm-type DNA-binding domain-containing protein [Alphaproteobacteria bacterium]